MACTIEIVNSPVGLSPRIQIPRWIQLVGLPLLVLFGWVLATTAGHAVIIFIVAALSLAGMPPFSGFLSKLVLAQAGLAGGNYVVVSIAVITSFLTLYSMSKIWSYAFWGERRHVAAPASYRGMMAPTAVLVAFTIAMGMFAQPFLGLATRAADTLTRPDEYIRVVLSAKQNRLAEMSRPAAQVVARAEEGR